MVQHSAFPFDIPYSLAADDALFFLHIYKCAGGSLTHILMRAFPDEKTLLCHNADELFDLSPRELATYVYIHGHVGYKLMDYYPARKKPLWITMLRDPMERAVSHFFFKRQTHDSQVAMGFDSTELQFIMDNDFDTFARSHFPGANNMQARTLFLRRGEKWPQLPYTEDEIIEILSDRLLNECIFFGLAERFQESLQLLYYTLGWRPYELETTTRYHVTHDRLSVDDLSPETIEVIHDHNRIDFAIHALATEVFAQRHQAMVDDLRASYGHDASIHDMLHQRFLENTANRVPEVESIDLRHDDPLFAEPNFADGFHEAEEGQRWTGPTPESRIYLNLRKDAALKIEVDVTRGIRRRVLSSFELLVNGQVIPVGQVSSDGQTGFFWHCDAPDPATVVRSD